MKNKITLITPPDIFENLTNSVLFVNIVESDQEKITNWLSNSASQEDLNVYYYSGEKDTDWLLYALSRADICFIDVDNHCDLTKHIVGYILAKAHVYYQTNEEKVGNIFQHINANRVPDIDYFLANALSSLVEPDK